MKSNAISNEQEPSEPAIRNNENYPENCHVFELPYRHVLCEKVFEPEKVNALLDWLTTKAKWRYEDRCFYQQYACRNFADCTDADGKSLINNSIICLLMEMIEAFFDVSIRKDQYHIAVHKLIPGQGIGVHTDRPDEGSETHRFVAHLNAEFRDSFGGHLLMFLDRAGSKLANIVRPLNNSGVAFALSDSSFHAVNNVKGGIRYSIVFSFWDVNALHQGEGVPLGDLSSYHGEKQFPLEGKYQNVVRLLDALGADTILHGRGTLLDHLLETYNILKEERAPTLTCLAGLCHSVYGTSSFSTALLSLGQRSVLRDYLGRAAERIVYLYCISEFMVGDNQNSIVSRITRRPLRISDREGQALRLIATANQISQC